MSEHLIDFRDVNSAGQPTGRNLKLDLDTGRVYDEAGTQIAQWRPQDPDKTAMLADYASAYADQVMAYSMSTVDKDRARQMAVCMAANRGETGELVAMDLGQADVHIPAAMPNYASGYRNEPPIADLMSPPLLAPKASDKYWEFAKEDAFQRAIPNLGAPGAVGEVAPRLGNQTYSTTEYALAGWVPTQVEANADAPLRILQATTRRVMNALMIERELRVSTLLTTSGNWNSAQVATIAAGAEWNGGASSDPIKNLHDRIEASFGGITGIGMSERTFHSLQRNSQVQKYIQYKVGADPLPNAARMSALLELPPIYVARMKYITAADTSAPSYVWGNHVVLIRQPEEMPPSSQEDVATSYTFRWNVANVRDGQATNGWVVRQYFTQDRGSMGGSKIVVVHNDAEKMTGKFVGGLLLNAYQ